MANASRRGPVFGPVAWAGAYKVHEGGTTPGDDSPCGTCWSGRPRSSTRIPPGTSPTPGAPGPRTSSRDWSPGGEAGLARGNHRLLKKEAFVAHGSSRPPDRRAPEASMAHPPLRAARAGCRWSGWPPPSWPGRATGAGPSTSPTSSSAATAASGPSTSARRPWRRRRLARSVGPRPPRRRIGIMSEDHNPAARTGAAPRSPSASGSSRRSCARPRSARPCWPRASGTSRSSASTRAAASPRGATARAR
jgi:hypothetical protein